MAFTFNGNVPKNIIYNGQSLSTLVYNGDVVWTYKFLTTVLGVPPLTLTDATADPVDSLVAYGKCGQTGTPTPTNPLPIICNNGELKARHQSGLPLGYQRLRYMYADNIIDLGVKTTDDSDLEALWFSRSSTGSGYVYYSDSGSALTTNTTSYVSNSGNWRFGSKTISIEQPPANANITSIQNKEGVWWNGTKKGSYSNVGTFESENNLKLFMSSSSPKVGMSYLKMRSYASGELLHYWIACRRESDNKLGVYDLVGNTFYTNDDATITAGADASDPIEFYVEGTQETIEITGKNLFDKNNVTEGYFYDSNLEYTTSTLTSLSDFIPVIPGQQYTLSWQGSSGVNVRVNFFNENKVIDSQGFYRTSTTGHQTYTITVPSGMRFVRYSFRSTEIDSQQFEYGSTATTYEPYFNGGTATAENLFSAGDYEDEQEVITGNVVRNVKAIVLTGNEEWAEATASNVYYLVLSDSLYIPSVRIPLPSTHFVGTDELNANMPDNSIKAGAVSGVQDHDAIWVKMTSVGNLTAFKNYLATQYANGTPVIVVYPLDTPTTETVTAQPMSLQAGTNIVDITQASLDGLKLEVTYYRTN